MDRAAAIETVKRLGATDKKPALSDAVVGSILDGYALADLAGVAPNGAGWVPSYDVNGAVAEVWRSKGAAVAGDFTFTADDGTYNKGDVLANMLMLEGKYLALSVADRASRIGTASTLDVSGFTNTTLDQIAAQVIP